MNWVGQIPSDRGPAIVLTLFALSVLVFTKSEPASWADTSRMGSIQAIVEHGTLALDDTVYLHQGEFRQANYGLNVIYNNLHAGLWFRHSSNFALSAFSVHFGYEHDIFRIGYSYDFNVTDPWRTMQNMGAHEVTFLLKLEYKKGQRINFKAIKCPKS